MTGLEWLVLVPLALAWAGVMLDIALQPNLPPTMKALWAVACTLIWPMLVVYWLTRPMQGRAERVRPHSDRRHRLVHAALSREDAQLAGESATAGGGGADAPSGETTGGSAQEGAGLAGGPAGADRQRWDWILAQLRDEAQAARGTDPEDDQME